MDMKKKNHGKTSAKFKGGKIVNAYGRDNSDVTGSASDERGSTKGSPTDLGHSLKGTSANQRQP